MKRRRKLSLFFGTSDVDDNYNNKSKTIITHLQFDPKEYTLSFSIGKLPSTSYKIIFVERSSKIEWVGEFTSNESHISLNLAPFIQTYYNQHSRWDFYLEISNHQGEPLRSRLGVFDQQLLPKDQRYFPAAITDGVNVVTPYITELNGLSLLFIEPHHLINEKLHSVLKLVNFNMQNHIINGTVKVHLPEVQSFQIKSILLRYRSKNDHISFDFPVVEEKKTATKSVVHFTIDLSELRLQNYYWDFYLVTDIGGQEGLIRVKNPTDTVRRVVNKKSMKQSYQYENGYWVQPYITAANSIALLYKEKESHESTAFYIKENLAFLFYLLFKWYFDRKNIWLAFEKFSDSAQDNGFYFFQYCYHNKKKKNFFYIIKKDSPDYHNLGSMNDRVIHYMSFKYMVYMFAARLLISSESKGHAYDVRVQKGRLKKALNCKRQVFLQHGVIGLKRVDQVFKKTSKNAVDLFVVSSSHEKQIIINNFGYKDEEIIITGLSRWDVLTDQSNGKATILLMPTWRVWMDDLPEDKFIQTEYYRQYEALLNSDNLERMLEMYDISLNFFIHPKFKTYIEQFSSDNKRVKIYQFGETPLNQLLMQASLLITDYSSVSWDMYYQKKPVIFYQFDLEDYNKYQGSYIDMERDLFGDRAQDVDALILLIKKYAENGFKEEQKYAFMRKKYLTYTDHHNSSRIYQEIINHANSLKKRKRGLALYDSSLLRTLWAFAKKNEISFRVANYLKRILTNS
jgi:CDP-glycerol glycerophosphotransferase (TagB/SpsB family)